MKKQKLLISILIGLCVCLTSATLLTACDEEHIHSYTQQITTEATCTEKGVITYTCSCNDTYTEEIPALGHDQKIHQAQSPTCTEIGWGEYVTCEREGCEYSTYVEIVALDHDKVQHNAQAATCAEKGWEAYETCSRCDYNTYVEIPITGIHVWDEGELTTSPTCTEMGVKTFTCTVCKTATYTENINALTHEIKVHNPQTPTCVDVGWDAYATCNREGCNYTTYKELPATGNHAWNDGEITTKPTCTEVGVKTFTCTVCQTATKTENVNPLMHDIKVSDSKVPTCTEIGWNAYATCNRAGCDYTTYVEIPALDHNRVQHEAQAATCTEKGWNAYETCSRCDYTTYAEIPALDHDRVQHEAQVATCTEKGWNAYEACTRCSYTTYVEIPATGIHKWNDGEEIIAATCTKEGEITYTCTVCKTATKTESIAKAPHEHAEKWSNNTTQHWHECKCGDKKDEGEHIPSAPATATTKQICTMCGYLIQNELVLSTLTFNGNGATSGEMSDIIAYNTEIIIIPDCQYEKVGCLFMGWATSANGEVAFKTGDIYVMETVNTLYAVWLTGMTNMFDSEDLLYLPDEEGEEIYLLRGGVYFKGVYDADKKEFIFWNKREDVFLEGKIISNQTYVYYDELRAEYSCTLYEMGVGLDECTKIYFDGYNGITYVIKDSSGITYESKGRYVLEDDFYVATFTSGDLKGQTLTIMLGTLRAEDSVLSVFKVRNEEEYNWGALSRLSIYNNSLVFDDANDIAFDGFGVATLDNKNYTYITDKAKNIIRIYDNNGNEIVSIRVVEEDGLKGYVIYDESLDETFTLNDSTTLILDGTYNAKYVGDTTVTAYFTATDSKLGGKIVRLTNEEEYTFLFKQVSTAEGESIEYAVEKKLMGYAEYYYQDANGVYYAPMMVIEDPAAGKATLYGYTAEKKYLKVSVGSYIYNKENGLYVYTAEEYFEAPDVFTNTVDLATIKSFVCALDSELTSYQVHYWYDYTDVNGNNTILSEVYVEMYGTASLRLVGGFAIYNDGSTVTTGIYTNYGDYIQISTPDSTIFVELRNDGAGKTFVILNNPFKAFLVDEYGKVMDKEYIKADGKDNATYYVENDLGEVVISGVGSLECVGKTLFGIDTYEFVSAEKTFTFVLLNNNDQFYVRLLDTDWQGDFETSVGTLTLDGYGYQASLNAKEGWYSLNEEGLLVFTSTDGEIVLFEKSNGKLTALGDEYGDYEIVENNYASGIWVTLDGKNGLTVYKKDEIGNNTILAENGTYTFKNNECVLSYNSNGETVVLLGVLEDNKFLTKCDESCTLVNNDDFSVLILDGCGNAAKYDKNGRRQMGNYTIITDNLLYFASNDSEDSGLYAYDITSGWMSPVKLYDVMYYNWDFETLRFASNGLAVFDGEDKYFYYIDYDYIDYDGRVILYQKAETGGNKYGFVEESFGFFANTIAYNGKDYYRLDGLSITFERETSTANEYPIENGVISEITFTPPGGVYFTTNGYVTYNGQRMACTVVRNVDGDGSLETYIMLGNYRVDIDFDFWNENFIYRVTNLKWIVTAPSYNYLQMLYLYNMLFGTTDYPNDIGELILCIEYGVEGKIVENGYYMTGNFGNGSKMYDVNGEIITFDRAEWSFNEETGIYTAKFEKDGYLYAMHFTIQRHPQLNINGYFLYAFTRQEILKTNINGNEYIVCVERIIATESGDYAVGGIYSMGLIKDGVNIQGNELYFVDNVAYYVVREKEGELNKSAIYYVITLNGENIEFEENIIPLYQSVTIEEVTVTTIYAEDGVSFVELDETKNAIKFLYLGGDMFIVETCVYEDGVYKVTCKYGGVFTVEIENDKAVIVWDN